MQNVLLQQNELPPFSQIQADQVEPAIQQILDENRAAIKTLLDQPQAPSWLSLVMPLDQLNDRLNQSWSPVQHMNAVVNESHLRDAYNACLPLLTDYGSELGQSQPLYAAFQKIAEGPEYAGLNQAQKKHIDNTLRDFRLAGVALPQADKVRYQQLKKRLSELSSKFAENVLDATQAWTKLVNDEKDLAGVPASALAAMEQAAKAQGKEGYLINLEYPSFFPILTYADNRTLREEVYRANVTRASECGPHAGQWDNSALIEETLKLRHELAQLLGFENYAAYSLATKMAESPAQVMEFLTDLGARVKDLARAEFNELAAYAKAEFGIDALQPWDVGYYSEKLRQQQYAISQEALRPYFPVDQVIQGMFKLVKQLFAIDIAQQAEADTWHPDVRFYQISRKGKPLGKFYLDLYARNNKRGGAWMDDCRVRRRLSDGGLQLPVAYLTCNFNGPVGDAPALLTHNEVTTLFHEFGHGLHHMLTQIDVPGVSGINGVPWDAVELPSQFMENWCWQPEGIALISKHYQTGEPLPQEMLDKMLAAKNFQSAMQTVRQLEFALFDFRLHQEYNPAQPQSPQAVLDEVRATVSVVPAIAENRFQNSFSHIFAGGYAAGYYSYKWAEVLSADAFSRFEEEGVMNTETGQRYLNCILEQGGAQEPMALFVAFRGREPQIDALLRHEGLIR